MRNMEEELYRLPAVRNFIEDKPYSGSILLNLFETKG